MPYLIPDDWDGEKYVLLALCVPDSEKWIAAYTGAVSYLNRGWSWDEKTGDINETIQIAREAYMSLSICGMTAVVDAINNVALAINNQRLEANCCGACGGTIVDTTGDVDGTEPEPPVGYVTPDPTISNYACSMANVYYQSYRQLIGDLVSVGFESQLSLGISVISTTLQAIFAGQAGLLARAAQSLGFLSDAVLLFLTEETDLSELLALWNANEQEIVCAVYSASSSSDKEQAVNSVVNGWTTTTGNKSFIELLNSVNVMVSVLYTPEGQAARYADDIASLVDPVDCSLCGLVTGPVYFIADRGLEVPENQVINDPANIGQQITLYAQQSADNRYRLEFWIGEVGRDITVGNPCGPETTIVAQDLQVVGPTDFRGGVYCDNGLITDIWTSGANPKRLIRVSLYDASDPFTVTLTRIE